jgi:hypothetical protein
MQRKKTPVFIEIGQGDAHHPSPRVIRDLKMPALAPVRREAPFEHLIHGLNDTDQMDAKAFGGPQTDPFLIRDQPTIRDKMEEILR